jgi:hypothetical protein
VTIADAVTSQVGQLVAVYEVRAGSSLASDLAAGAVVLSLVDVDDFADAGGQLDVVSVDDPDVTVTAVPYAGVDRDADTVELVSPWAGSGFVAGDSVWVSPAATERRADVALDGETDQTVVARVPFALASALTFGVRDDHAGEWVRVVVDDYGYTVTDAYLEPATVDPEVLPPTPPATGAGTDGIPPSTSPASVKVDAGISALIVTWSAITNADPVTYDVWVGPSGGVLAKVGSTAGTGPFWVKYLSDGTAVSSDTAYDVQVVATDADGPAPTPSPTATGTPIQATTDDIAADAITANEIAAGSIVGEHLAAAVIVGTKIVTPAETGQRVQIDPSGLANYGPDEALQVLLPTDPGAPALFRGLVEASIINVLQAIHISGTTSTLEQSSMMTLRQGLRAATTPPTVRTVWPQLALPPDPAVPTPTYSAACYVPNGYGGGPTFLVGEATPAGSAYPWRVVERAASDGSIRRTFAAGLLEKPVGIASDGTVFYVAAVGKKSTSTATLFKIRHSDGVTIASAPYPWSTLSNGNYATGTIGYDGTNLLGAWIDDQVRLRWRTVTLPDGGTVTTGSAVTVDPGIGWQAACILTGLVFAEGSAWFQISKSTSRGDGAFAYNPALAGQTGSFRGDNYTFTTPSTPAGLAHNGTAFRSLLDSGAVVQHTSWDWTTGSARYWVRYTWFEDNAPAGVGVEDYESAPSPSVKLDHKKRAAIEVTLPAFPPLFVSGASMGARVYFGNGSSDPGAAGSALQALTFAVTTQLSAYNPAGAVPPTTSTFPVGTPATIATDDGSPLLRANGFSRFRVRKDSTSSIAHNTPTSPNFGVEEVDTDNYWPGSANNNISIPYTGTYLFQAIFWWAAASGGYRWAWLESSTDGGTTWAQLPALVSKSGTQSGGEYTNTFGGMVGLTAGTLVRPRVQQNSGAAATLNTEALQGCFLGPT